MRPFDPKTILCPELDELKAYTPSEGSYEVRLDANEAPDILSPEMNKRLSEIAAKTAWNRYPDAGQTALRRAIAAHLGVNRTQVIAGVGSDELIALLLTAATRLKSKAPSPTLVTTTPTFVMYRLSARVRGQRVMEVPLDSNWDLEIDSLLRAVEIAQPNIIFIASPNNPTGTMVSEERLEALITAAPGSLVVVDEAYIDYADRTQLELLERFENVAILRTLSKIGFASLRVGWLIGSPPLVAELDKVRLPYNLPTLTQNLATCVFEEFSSEVSTLCQTVKSERLRVAETLTSQSGIQVVPSQANFLWIELEKSAKNVFAALAKKGVLVRSFHGRGGRLEKHIRVTIGTPDENNRFLSALSETLQGR